LREAHLSTFVAASKENPASATPRANLLRSDTCFFPDNSLFNREIRTANREQKIP
jgi:hypothetical protein